MSSISRRRIIEDGIVLPGVLSEIADAAGEDAALKIAEAFGGTEIVVPALSRLIADHQLSRLIGLDAARKVCELLIGRVAIPRGSLAPQVQRIMEVRRLLLEGHSNALVARMTGVHVRTVCRMKRDMREAGDPVSAHPSVSRTPKRTAGKAVEIRALLHLSNDDIAKRVGVTADYVKSVRNKARRAEAARLGKVIVK